jgi:hypothetical protein
MKISLANDAHSRRKRYLSKCDAIATFLGVALRPQG